MKSHVIVWSWMLTLLFVLSFVQKSFAADAAPQSTPSAQSIGQVVWVKGVVKALGANNAPRTLQRRSPLYLKDTIETDNNSTGEIVFTDNSIVSLRSATELRVDDYAFGKDTPPGKAKYVASLVKGGFRTITGLIPKDNPKNYQVNTPVATIGVRGTDYVVAIKKDGSLMIGYYKGSPCVSSATGTSVCLTPKNPYYAVNTDGTITQLPSAPAEFSQQPGLTKVTFNSVTAGAITGPPGSVPGQPVNNSFCIQ